MNNDNGKSNEVASATSTKASIFGSFKSARTAIRKINDQAEMSRRALDEWANGLERQLQQAEDKLNAIEVGPVENSVQLVLDTSGQDEESRRVAELVATCNALLEPKRTNVRGYPHGSR